jgi:hypothetical protein
MGGAAANTLTINGGTLAADANSELYQCHFEIGLCIAKEGGMAVSAV